MLGITSVLLQGDKRETSTSSGMGERARPSEHITCTAARVHGSRRLCGHGMTHGLLWTRGRGVWGYCWADFSILSLGLKDLNYVYWQSTYLSRKEAHLVFRSSDLRMEKRRKGKAM